jgi:hypothetical protein
VELFLQVWFFPVQFSQVQVSMLVVRAMPFFLARTSKIKHLSWSRINCCDLAAE